VSKRHTPDLVGVSWPRHATRPHGPGEGAGPLLRREGRYLTFMVLLYALLPAASVLVSAVVP
jgi:hypothetical protein